MVCLSHAGHGLGLEVNKFGLLHFPIRMTLPLHDLRPHHTFLILFSL